MASVKEIREKVKQKRLSDLLTKHQAGKTSVTEVKELDALLAERENLEKPKENVCNWKCSIVQLSELFMVTKKTIRDWVKKGMPKDSYSVYDLKKVFPWWLENINSGPEDRD